MMPNSDAPPKRITRRKSIRTARKSSEKDVNSQVDSTDSEDDRNEDLTNSKDCKPLYPELPRLNLEGLNISQEQNTLSSAVLTRDGQSVVKHKLNWPFVILILAAVIGCCCAIFWLFSQSGTNNSERRKLRDALSNLEKEYPQQSDLSWKVLRSSLKKHLNASNPKSPAKLLLVSLKGAQCLASCLARNLMTQISTYLGNDYAAIDGSELHENPLEAKKEIDKKFAETFKDQSKHSIFIEHLDDIPAKSAAILHGFCDHENSPYKQAIIIMHVSTDESSLSANSFHMFDKLAVEKLELVWKDLGVDKLNALITRVTESVAVIQQGRGPSSCHCSK